MAELRTSKTVQLTSSRLLHLQQWLALAFSLLCLAVDVWAFSNPPEPSSSINAWLRIPNRDLLWLAEGFTALTACAILPFAFHADSEDTPQSIHRQRGT